MSETQAPKRKALSLDDLERVLARAAAEHWTELALIGSTNWSFERWPAERAFVLAQPLTSVPIALTALTDLTALDLSYNQIGDEGAQVLAGLINLISLELTNNQIADEGARALRSLTGLRNLGLRVNDIGDEGAEVLAGLTGLTTLDLRVNRIGAAGAAALSTMPGLSSLNLFSNAIGDNGARALAGSICTTSLNLGDNNIGDEGAGALATLTRITSLDLSRNHIGDEGARALANLAGLVSLNLAGNNIRDDGVRFLAKGRSANGLQSLNLRDNPISEIPKELIESRNAQTIFTHVLAAERPLHAAKLLLVGQGVAGKTHVRKRLLEGDAFYINVDEERTHNVDMRAWTLDAPAVAGGPRVPVTLRVLDFGGQPHLHASHRFFLNDERNLYVLVLDATRTLTENRAEYWLKIIAANSPGAPVVIAVNKCDERERRLEALDPLVLDRFRRTGAMIVCEPIEGYGWPPGGMVDERARREARQRHDRAHVALLDAIRGAVAQVAGIEMRYARGFHEGLSWLERTFPADPPAGAAPPKYIAFDQYREECLKLGMDKDLVEGYLLVYRSLGLVHYVGDRRDIPERDDTKQWIFNPAWVKGPAYQLITPSNDHDHGVMTEDQLRRRFAAPMAEGDDNPLWKRMEFTNDDRRFVISLMQWCELCFEFRGEDGACRYLFPDLLPDVQVRTHYHNSEVLREELLYTFLPDTVLLRFIGQRYGWVEDKQKDCCRNEVIVRDPGQPCEAVVFANVADSKIEVQVRGGGAEDRQDFLIRLRHDLSDIHKPISTERSSRRRRSRGELFEQFHGAVVEAFSIDELERLAGFHLNVQLAEIASPHSPLPKVAFELLMWAKRHGGLDELTAAIVEARPRRTDIAQLADMIRDMKEE